MSSENKNTVSFDNRKKSDNKSRNLGITIGSIIILILAAISFIFIPAIGQGVTNNTLPPFGYYNNVPIKYEQNSYFTNMLQQYEENLKNNGEELNATNSYSVFSAAFNSTVINLAATDEVTKSGYVVPDITIKRAMLPYFSDATGAYSPKVFADTPNNEKLALRKGIKESLIYQRFIEDFFGTNATQNAYAPQNMYGIKASSKELAFVQQIADKKRSFDLVSFPLNKYPDTEVLSYGKENAELFNKYDLSVITVDTESTAKSLLSRLTKQEIVFADAITEYSTMYYSAEDGKLSSSYQYQIEPILTNKDDLSLITSLNPGETSGIIKNASGKFSIFHADGATAVPDFNSTDIVATIKSYMTSYESGIIQDYFIGIANDFITKASVTSFAQASGDFDITPVTVSEFPLNYSNLQIMDLVPSSTIQELSGAETNESFLKTAFSLQQDEISSPIVLGSNVLVLQLTNEIVTAEEGNFNMVEYLFPYYSTQYDQNALQSKILGSDKLKNDFMNVYFKYFLQI